MTSERPSRDSMYGLVFQPNGELQPRTRRQNLRRLTCTRRDHTIAWALKTTYGWWVAWRRTEGGWDYDWADQVTGYTEAKCACGRARRVDEMVSRMR